MRETPRPKGKNVQPRRLTVLISEYSLKPITDISLRSEKPVKSKILDDFEKIRNFVQRLLLRVSCEFDSRRGCQYCKSVHCRDVRIYFYTFIDNIRAINLLPCLSLTLIKSTRKLSQMRIKILDKGIYQSYN